jgi:hypothetical protein
MTDINLSLATDPDHELLDLEQLLSLGLDPADARDVLGPHSALTRREVEDRYEMLRRERESRL